MDTMNCPECKEELVDQEYCYGCGKYIGTCPVCKQTEMTWDEDGEHCHSCGYTRSFLQPEQWTYVPGVGFINQIGERW